MSANARSVLALLAALAGAVACGNERAPAAPAQLPFLLDAIGRATLERRDPGVRPTATLESGPDGAAWMRIPLGDGSRWEPAPSARVRRLGLNDPKLRAWYFDLRLPTTDARRVRLEGEAGPFAEWVKGEAPPAFSSFYQAGGFIRNGLYAVLPAGVRPGPLRVEFPPTDAAQAELRAVAGQAIDPRALATHATLGAVTRPALLLPPGVAVVFPLQVPANARLRLGAGRALRPGIARAQHSSLQVALRARGSQANGIERRIEFREGAAETWSDVEIDLERFAGQPVEIVLAAAATESEAASFHYVSDPVISPASGPASRVQASAPSPAGSTPNLVLFVIDGLRADRFEEEQRRAALLPTLAALAARGTVFAAAHAPAPWTRPSISSLFSGTHPARHGVQRESASDVLPAELATLAETLRRAGYATGAVSANLHVHPAFGLHRGFSELRTELADGRVIVRHALDWIDARAHEPFFLFVFLMDTHYPFRHRPEYDRSSGLAATPPTRDQVTAKRIRQRDGTPEPTAGQIEVLEALYDENVRYADEALRDLLTGLSARKLTDRSVIAVTADHGEAFAEHGDLFHGWNLFSELLRVPLVVAGPGIAQGRSVRRPFSLVDLPATLLAGVGADPVALPGQSQLVDDRSAGESVFAQTRFRAMDLAAVVEGRDKLILNRSAGVARLFDLGRDPGERVDRSTAEPERSAELAQRLRNWLAAREAEARPGTPGAAATSIPAEVQRQLEALGYVDDSSP